MDTASLQFVAFGLVVAIISNFSRSAWWRSMVLMAASIVFVGLAAHSPLLLLPLAGFLLLGYGALVLLQRGSSRALAWIVITVIFTYIWLKKYTFLPHGMFLRSPYTTLGLSYIFFRVLHLLIETGDRAERRRVTLYDYLLYTLNFTTLVSGPIQRYDEFAADQFAREPIPLGIRTIGMQLERIVRGFFKVNVLAALFYALQQNALAQVTQTQPTQTRMLAAGELAILYPLFLYANFSGYIDIVIALARLMRLWLPENFNRPFSAPSFIDFWNRWHITLSMWLKTYVYNPLLLALMRHVSSPNIQPYLGVLCFFVTFFLVGIWHGRTSEFVMFGLLQGGGVAANKLWQIMLTRWLGKKSYKAVTARAPYIAFSRGLTFTWFAFTLFWFWASWKQIASVFGSVSGLEWMAVWGAVWVSAALVLAMWERARGALLSVTTSEGPVLTSRYARVVYSSALGLIAFVVTILLSQPAPDIVYKAF